jgi:hypothetical protein
LQTIDEDDDVLTAMARELVTRQGVGEAAAEVWRSLQQQATQEKATTPVSEPLIDLGSAPEPEMPMPTPAMGPAVQLSLF